MQDKMTANQKAAPVIGPLGRPLTIEMLPHRDVRWNPRRKAEVVAAVSGGLLTIEDACRRYDMDVYELESWQRTTSCSLLNRGEYPSPPSSHPSAAAS